ncbi:S8 family peptidase [Paenibacillus terrigena]|uniref:S8 family peptidase n=1 Tax=Paenibacillus terrigena TaxID=369333 RepID=UPI00037A5B42|nr:S8 family peptidase [Paenibacillus terrigena]
MDYSTFLQLLHDEIARGGGSQKKQIIRFVHTRDFRRCLTLFKKMKSSLAMLSAVQPSRIIHAMICPAISESKLSMFKNDIFIEKDARVMKVHATAHKNVQWDHGIPWGVQHIRAPQTWSTSTGHRIRIGVIDTGVDYRHPDLRHSLMRGINLLNRNMLPYDDNGHGTHIAGTIAAANQLKGIIGVAPRALIHPVKAFDHNGSAYVSDIILGIDWCVRNRMHVINMSFGMKSSSKALLNAVVNAYNAGVVIVASSGNDSKRKSVDYPARYPQTIAVGATNRLHRVAKFSNRGPYIDIYAPGDKIISSWLRGNYNEMSGTSMATSHVSGAIALLLAQKPGLSPSEIKALLRRSATTIRGLRSPKPAPGEVDALRLLREAER